MHRMHYSMILNEVGKTMIMGNFLTENILLFSAFKWVRFSHISINHVKMSKHLFP